jgi:release factor glutamine methyltransferase
MSASLLTLNDALRQSQAWGLDRLDAQMLLLRALGRDANDRAWLLAHDGDALPDDAAAHWQADVKRRLTGEPLAYIAGEKAFFGLSLRVDSRVLVPRPDTETLVQWALDLLPPSAATARLLDLGTGSGAIALAVKSRRPGVAVSASDVSTEALSVAQSNARRLNLAVQFHTGHWLEAVAGQCFDIIVSNPPYIAEGDPHLTALGHEPISALTAGIDGLDDVRQLVADAPSHLSPGGWLLLEHGHDQAETVRELLVRRGFAAVSSRTDLAGIERCSGGQWPPER